MEKEKILKEYEEEFEKLKKVIGFKANLEDLESEFYIKDYILEMGHVRTNLIMQITSRIVDYFRNWANFLNTILIPNPGFMPSQTEAKIFSSEDDRKDIWKMLRLCMDYSSKYSLMFVSKDMKMQKDFIDDSLEDWKNILRPFIKKVMLKINDAWEKE